MLAYFIVFQRFIWRILLLLVGSIFLSGVSVYANTTTINQIHQYIHRYLSFYHVGIVAEDLRTGQTLVNINGEKGFIPASVTKALTAKIAHDVLAQDFHFSTRLAIKTTASIHDGILNGNLYILSNGDPHLTSKDFADLIDTLTTKNGIHTIQGNIYIIVPNVYEGFTPGILRETTWFAYFSDDYDPFYLDDNAITMLSNHNTYSHLQRKVHQYCYLAKRMIQGRPEFVGCIAPSIKSIRVRSEDPMSYMTSIIGRIIQNQKIVVKGHVSFNQHLPSNMRILSVLNGQSLKAMIQHMLYYSDNIYAASLAQASLNVLKDKYINIPAMLEGQFAIYTHSKQLSLVSPSGLSYFNQIRPIDMTTFMKYLYRTNKIFLQEEFPSYGKGTLLYRISPIKKSYLKTGYLDNASSLSGIVMGISGNPIAITIFINGTKYNASFKQGLYLRSSIDALVAYIADYTKKIAPPLT